MAISIRHPFFEPETSFRSSEFLLRPVTERCLRFARNRWFESISLQQTVSLSPAAAFEGREPRFPRGSGQLAWRPGQQRRAGCFDFAPTGGNISVEPYSSTAVPLTACENATPIGNKVGPVPGVMVRWICQFGWSSGKAERDPLIVPGKRQAGVVKELLRRQIARLPPIEDRARYRKRGVEDARLL